MSGYEVGRWGEGGGGSLALRHMTQEKNVQGEEGEEVGGEMGCDGHDNDTCGNCQVNGVLFIRPKILTLTFFHHYHKKMSESHFNKEGKIGGTTCRGGEWVGAQHKSKCANCQGVGEGAGRQSQG
jgi:hypothetical protein